MPSRRRAHGPKAAASCFAIKRTIFLGGLTLLVVLAAAALAHPVIGEAPRAAFVVDAAGIVAAISHRDQLVANHLPPTN